jgi:hypothetical protein
MKRILRPLLRDGATSGTALSCKAIRYIAMDGDMLAGGRSKRSELAKGLFSRMIKFVS